MVTKSNNQFGMSALKSIFNMGLLNNNNTKKSKKGTIQKQLKNKKEINRRRNKVSHTSKMKNFKLAKTRNGKKHFKI